MWPVALGYLRVVTHPTLLGAPLAPEVAVENIEQFTSRPHVRQVGEANGFWPVYRRVADPVKPRGNLVPDAHLVALMRHHASPRSGVTTATSASSRALEFATPSPADGVGPAAAVDHHGRLHAVSDAILGEQLAESSDFIAAIDQGTTSTRCMIFDHHGAEVARHQLEHEQILPRAGWVEHNPVEIWERTASVLISVLNATNLSPKDIAALGITNQRETTLVWNRHTGRPYYNAIVWQDTRTDRIASALDRDGRGNLIRRKAGLPPATYFSGGKLQWILENVDGVRAAAENGGALFGTPDTWVLWNLTGGPRGGVHVTDVTNASRTMLMDLETLDWDDELLSLFSIPRAMLPEIASSAPSEPYGVTLATGPVGGEVPITGVLGDQHAAMVGQVCLAPGEAKNTYGTGNFLLLNTGETIVRSNNGLLTRCATNSGTLNPCTRLKVRSR